ncbi:hypothetical protein [Halalkalicoccus salilacus]|uniref:hypothetical protein n=1 Tax=Halalkalicoccus TaxID=332246 RepID=UPI002F9677BF
MPLDTEQVTVQYAPAPESTYLGSSATVPVALEQVEPTIEVTDSPEEVAFGEEMTVRGSVAADGTGAGDVPVAVEVDGQHLGTTTTDANGAYELTTTLPAEAASGDNTVDVTIPVGDRALAGTSTSAPITVAETDSALTLNAQPTGENNLEVTGRLTTANGEGINGQPITVRVGGSSVATLETADDGAYEGEVPLDQIEGTGERTDVEVVAVYNDGGNVRNSQATAEVTIDEEAEPDGLIAILGVVFVSLLELFGIHTPDIDLGEQSFGLVHWLVLLAFAIGLPISSYPLVRYFESDDDDDEPETEDTERARDTAPQPDDEPVNISLDEARTLIEGDPKRAVKLAYTIVRAELAEHTDETARTHREFYQACQSNGFSNEELAALETLTDQYEHAAFAERPVSTTKAEQAIDTARQFIT